MSTPIAVPDFATFLVELSAGEVNEALTQRLRDVAAAVNETGLKGEVTVKLTLQKARDVAQVDCEIKTKVPEHPQHSTLFHFHENGLVRDDPRQLKLKGLKEPELRTVHNFPTDDNSNN